MFLKVILVNSKLSIEMKIPFLVLVSLLITGLEAVPQPRVCIVNIFKKTHFVWKIPQENLQKGKFQRKITINIFFIFSLNFYPLNHKKNFCGSLFYFHKYPYFNRLLELGLRQTHREQEANGLRIKMLIKIFGKSRLKKLLKNLPPIL